MSDVLSMIAVLPLDLARGAGFQVDVDALYEGMPYTEADLRRARPRRVAWDDYSLFLDRLAEAVGGVDVLTAIGADLDRASPWIDWMLGTILTPYQLFSFWCSVVPRVWRPLRMEVARLPGRPFLVRMTLEAGYRDCRVFWMVNRASLSTFVCRIGLPPATVVLESLAEREVVYRVTPAPESGERRAFDRVDAMVEAMAQTPMEELAPLPTVLLHPSHEAGPPPRPWPTAANSMSAFPPTAAPKVRASAADWGLTGTQELVLAEMVRGLSNKEIGVELGMAEATVEVHATQIYRKSGLRGRSTLIMRFWAGLSLDAPGG